MQDADGNNLEVNSSGQLKVVLDGKVCSCNTTATPLLADATFTGTASETLDYALVFVNAHSNVASATNGLVVQVSSDSSTWYDAESFTIPADTDKTFSFQPSRRYFRVKYTNGGTDQTTFDMEVIFKKTNSKASSHKISDVISPEDDAELQKSVLTALSDSGSFTNIHATASNNLKVANVENGLSIAKGDVTSTTFIHKFGAAEDFDFGDGSVTVWDGADDADLNLMQYVYSTSAAIDTISSSSGSV
jgi:hypothetical protein